jgi:hypothetical protein
MAAKAVRGQASAGDIALFYQAFQQGAGPTRTLLGNIGQIYLCQRPTKSQKHDAVRDVRSTQENRIESPHGRR